MRDPFNEKQDRTVPANGGAAVTPSDEDDLSVTARALYIGTAGNVAVIAVDGTTPIFVGVPAGTILPIRVSRVLETDTTAEDIVALY